MKKLLKVKKVQRLFSASNDLSQNIKQAKWTYLLINNINLSLLIIWKSAIA